VQWSQSVELFKVETRDRNRNRAEWVELAGKGRRRGRSSPPAQVIHVSLSAYKWLAVFLPERACRLMMEATNVPSANSVALAIKAEAVAISQGGTT